MSKILEGMARAYLSHFGTVEPQAADKLAMGFALLWLADNVSDEMVDAAEAANVDNVGRSAIAAALRQAAGGGE